MVERIIELSVRHKWVVLIAAFVLALWAVDSVRKTPLDALPDLSDPQVIVYSEWMGSPSRPVPTQMWRWAPYFLEVRTYVCSFRRGRRA